MPELDRLVAGVRCREVLAALSSYVDGELSAARVQQLEAHVRGCDWCERFGGEFADIMRTFRASLREADALDADVEQRLRERLRAAVARNDP